MKCLGFGCVQKPHMWNFECQKTFHMFVIHTTTYGGCF